MSILVLDCGSSSLKCRLVDVETETGVASGMVEPIGESDSVRDHREALEYVLASLGTDGIAAVAHRVVHGGARFTEPVLVEDAVLRRDPLARNARAAAQPGQRGRDRGGTPVCCPMSRTWRSSTPRSTRRSRRTPTRMRSRSTG